MSLQNPLATSDPRQNYAWSLLQFNFVQALTNAGGTVALVTNPNVAYDSFCENTSVLYASAEQHFAREFKLAYDTVISGYFRVVVSGTVYSSVTTSFGRDVASRCLAAHVAAFLPSLRHRV